MTDNVIKFPQPKAVASCGGDEIDISPILAELSAALERLNPAFGASIVALMVLAATTSLVACDGDKKLARKMVRDFARAAERGILGRAG